MPEMTFTVRWPDGRVQECWSPSLVVHDHLEAGASLTVADFVQRSTRALAIGSDRVREKFGFACTASAASAEQITRAAAAHAPDQLVHVVSMHPPLPPSQPLESP